MHYVVISDELLGGGASIATTRLVESYLESGLKVTRIVGSKGASFSSNCDIISLFPNRNCILKVIRRMFPEGLFRKYLGKILSKNLRKILKSLRPDAINIHNIHLMSFWGWSHEIVSICQDYAPTIWTLHDLWSITGRCAYPANCKLYLSKCNHSCPTFDEYPSLNKKLIENNWIKNKKVLIDSHRLIGVTPSEWLKKKCQEGLWEGKPIKVIKNPCPLTKFSPSSKNQSSFKKLDNSIPTILLIAYNLHDQRKDINLAKDSLLRVKQRCNILLCGGGKKTINKIGNHNIIDVGFIKEQEKLIKLYCCSSIYLHLASEDNLPNTIVEALSCGLPVIARNIGGIPEIVQEGKTGWLINDPEPAIIAQKIDNALYSLKKGNNIAELCRHFAEQNFNPNLISKQYVEALKLLPGVKS